MKFHFVMIALYCIRNVSKKNLKISFPKLLFELAKNELLSSSKEINLYVHLENIKIFLRKDDIY